MSAAHNDHNAHADNAPAHNLNESPQAEQNVANAAPEAPAVVNDVQTGDINATMPVNAPQVSDVTQATDKGTAIDLNSELEEQAKLIVAEEHAKVQANTTNHEANKTNKVEAALSKIEESFTQLKDALVNNNNEPKAESHAETGPIVINCQNTQVVEPDAQVTLKEEPHKNSAPSHTQAV